MRPATQRLYAAIQAVDSTGVTYIGGPRFEADGTKIVTIDGELTRDQLAALLAALDKEAPE